MVKRKRRKPKPAVTVTLPDTRSEVCTELFDHIILIFGDKKIGKTSMLSHIPNAFFLMCDPGGKSLKLFQPQDANGRPSRIKTWQEFKLWVEKLLASDFDTIVIDTIDEAKTLCRDYMLKKLGVSHLGDLKWGEGWEKFTIEFRSVIDTIADSNKGLVMLSHESSTEVEDFSGEVYNLTGCSLSGKIQEHITGIVDIWAYYTYDRSGRSLYVTGSKFLDAGNRLTENFLDATTGEELTQISMGTNSKESYNNFIAAYKNEYSAPVKRKKKRRTKKK